MEGISLTQAMQELGITRMQAEAMDEADGNKDGNIGKSIFNEAKEAISQGEEAKASFFTKIKVVQTPANDEISQPMVSDETQESYEDRISKEETRETMTDLACKAVEYYKKCGSFKGFKYTGFPNGVTNVKFDAKFVYDDSSNDTFDFDTQSAMREADTFVLTVTYLHKAPNGTITKEYTLVSVDTKKFEQTPIAEDFVGQLTDVISTGNTPQAAGQKPIMGLE